MVLAPHGTVIRTGITFMNIPCYMRDSACLFPVDTETKNVRAKDVHKRTFIFGSIWKHEKTSESESVMNVPMMYVLKTSFSRP